MKDVLGHSDVSTTMTYAHGLNRGTLGVKADRSTVTVKRLAASAAANGGKAVHDFSRVNALRWRWWRSSDVRHAAVWLHAVAAIADGMCCEFVC